MTAPRLCYCTNVHAGTTFAEACANLDRHAVAVRESVAPAGTLGIGLWLPASALAELADDHAIRLFGDRLAGQGLAVYTVNAFPYGDFHGDVVKRRVYEPDWRTPERLDYTLRLARVLALLQPEGGEAGLSTLPVGWREPFAATDAMDRAAESLIAAADGLARIESETGCLIHLDLEPEPGCVLDTAPDVVALFDRLDARAADRERLRRYVRVCHDVCHAAVMFEDQQEAFRCYDAAGIRVGKIQVSSAVRVSFADMNERERAVALEALRAFDEPRYLHQTVVRATDGTTSFYEDLPLALASSPPAGEWRVHFHVPIFADALGPLSTTRDEIHRCLTLVGNRPDIGDLEVETYAWNVLPPSHLPDRLADGIAAEMRWLDAAMVSGVGP